MKPRIAVFSGATATIGNSPPMVTSNKSRLVNGLPLLRDADGQPIRTDVLRAQRLAWPVTVYVEAFTAHPLERDATELFAPPDGWIAPDGTFTERDIGGRGKPVYVVELKPEDGVYPLPYMARQADGSAWDDSTSAPEAPIAAAKQTFYPDASRIYEEIDRLGFATDGRSVELSTVADFDFIRASPSGGWLHGRQASERTDLGEGDISSERLGVDFHGYFPLHLHREPTLGSLAHATNVVQRTLDTGLYVGAQWLEGSPTVEETMYWLGLLIDTKVPLVGHSAQRPHGSLSADGGRNIVDGVKYILSAVCLDDVGNDRIGAVLVVDEMVYAAREITKTDARPGGYEVVGGHGGVVADMGGWGAPQITFATTRRHTHTSDLCLPKLPHYVAGVAGDISGPQVVKVRVKDDDGLVASAMPHVSFTKYGRYVAVGTGEGRADASSEVEILARVARNLARYPLAGFVAEGMSPYGLTDPNNNAALQLATFSGMPVVRVGRGNTGGMAYRLDNVTISGNNLSATKARILLMAALLKLGALPPARNPAMPTPAETSAVSAAVAEYQAIFDSY